MFKSAAVLIAMLAVIVLVKVQTKLSKLGVFLVGLYLLLLALSFNDYSPWHSISDTYAIMRVLGAPWGLAVAALIPESSRASLHLAASLLTLCIAANIAVLYGIGWAVVKGWQKVNA